MARKQLIRWMDSLYLAQASHRLQRGRDPRITSAALDDITVRIQATCYELKELKDANKRLQAALEKLL